MHWTHCSGTALPIPGVSKPWTLSFPLSPPRPGGPRARCAPPASFGPGRACFSSLFHLPTLCHSSSPSFETQVSPRKPALVTVCSLPPLSPLLPGNMQTTCSQSWRRLSEQPSPKSPEGRGRLEPRANVSPSQLYSTQAVSGRVKAPQTWPRGSLRSYCFPARVCPVKTGPFFVSGRSR